MSGSVRLQKFGGIVPRLSPQLLPDVGAQTAENCTLKSGRLEPLKTLGASVAASTAATRSIYLWRYDGGEEWLSWNSDVDVVRGPVADDQYSRVYFTESGKLKVRGRSGGSSVTRTVGIPTPNKPTLTTSWKWAPSGTAGNTYASLKVRVGYTANAAGGSPSSFTTDVVGTFSGYSYTADGKLKMSFACPGGTLSPCTIEGQVANWSASLNGQLTVGALTIPASIGDALVGKSIAIKDSEGTTLATATVNGLSTSGWQIDWNKYDWEQQTTDFIKWPMTNLSPTFTPFTATVTLDMGWEQVETTYAVYSITFVDDWGQEGPASAASAQIEVKPGQSVSLSLPSKTAGYNLSKIRIYRSASTSTSDEAKYYYVGETTGSTFADTKRDADLAEVMPDTENPPGFDDPGLAADDDPNDTNGCYGLVGLPYGSLAGFYKKEVYFSEPYLPYSWPTKYRLTLDYDVVGLAVSGNDLVVLTKGHPYLISGYTPANLSSTRLMVNQSCVSKGGICNVGSVVVYPSPDGLVMISGGQARLATDKYFTRDDWQATNPTTIIAESHDGSVYCFSSAGTWVFDFDEGVSAVTTLTETAYALFADIETDILYVATASGVCALHGGATYRTVTWRSKLYAQDRLDVFRVLRIRGETAGGGTTTVKLYADRAGAAVHTATFTTFGDTPVPALAFAALWDVEVTTTDAIDEVLLLDEQVMTVTGPVSLKPKDMRFSWRDVRFFFPKTGAFNVGRVRAEKYPVTLKLYRDETLVHTETISNDADFVFPTLDPEANDWWHIDVNAPGHVYEVMLLPREAVHVDNAIRLSDRSNRPPSWRNMLYQFSRLGVFVVGRVRCETYPCTLTLTPQGEDPVVITVADDLDFYIPDMASTDYITVDLKDTGYVDEFLLVERQVFPVSGGIIRLNDQNRPWTWKAMVAQFSNVSSFSVARVRAETYPVTLKLTPSYGGTTEVEIGDKTDFVLPSLVAADRWQISLESDGYVDELLLIEKRVHTLNGSLRLTPAEVPYSWKGMYFQVPRVGSFNVARIRSERYPVTMEIYRDGSKVVTENVANDGDFKVLDSGGDPLVSADEWRIDLGYTEEERAPHEFVITSREATEVTGPIRLSDRQRPVSWLSMLYWFPRTGCFVAGRVRAETYPVTLRIYRDGVLSATKLIYDDSDFRIEPQTQTDHWSVDLVSSGWVHEFVLMPKVVETAGEVIRHVKATRPVTWRGMYYQFPRSNTFVVGRLRADSYPMTLNLYRDGSLAYTKAIADDADFRILQESGSLLTSGDQWEIDLQAGTTNVEELILFARNINTVNGPVRFTKHQRPVSWLGMEFHFPIVGCFSVARVRAETYPVDVKFYRDTTLVHTETIANDTDVKLPAMTSGDRWFVDVVPTVPMRQIDEVLLIPKKVHPVTGPIRLTDGDVASWKALSFYFPRQGMFRVARVRAETYPVTLNLYRGATLVDTQTINNETDIRLATTTAGDDWTIDLESTGIVHELLLFPRNIVQANGRRIQAARDGQSHFTWRGLEYDLVKVGGFSCAKVHAEAYPVTLTLRGDGTTLLATAVASSEPFRLPVMPRARLFEVDLVASGDVYEVVLARNMGDLRA